MISEDHTADPVDREPDSLDVMSMVRDVVDAVRQYKWTVVVICVITLAAATVYLAVWPPVYVAKANVMVERNEDVARDDFYIQWNVFRKEDALSELQLMKSEPILEQVIEKEQLKYEDIYHPMMSQLRYFWEESWPGRRYYGLKRRLFPPDTEVELTKEQIDFGRTIDDMDKGIRILPLGDSNVGQLTMKGPSPRVAKVANTLLDTYMDWRLELHQAEADRAYALLAQQTDKARQELSEIEAERIVFYREHDLQVGLQRERIQVEQLTGLESEIVRNRGRIASLNASLIEIDQRLNEEATMTTVASVEDRSTLRDTARMRRLEAEMTLIETRERFREDSPEVQELLSVIAKLDALIATEPDRIQSGRTDGINSIRQQLMTKRDALDAELAGETASLEVLTARADWLTSRLREVPVLEVEVKRLDHEYGLLAEKFKILAARLAQAEVSRDTVVTAMPSLRVVSYALPPSSKRWPTLKVIYPSALVVGLFLGVAAAMIRYYASGYVRRSDDIRKRGRAPVFGTIRVPTRGPLLTVPTVADTGDWHPSEVDPN